MIDQQDYGHHQHEDRELEGSMERAMAAAVGTASSLLESWARIQARRARTADPDKPTQLDHLRTASQELALADSTRRELAIGQPNPDYWLSASHENVMDQVREAGLDPYRMGERSHDAAWARQAQSRDVVDLLNASDRYADRSAVAASVRDNIGDVLRDYGVDPDELMKVDPSVAADQFDAARNERPTPGTHADVDDQSVDEQRGTTPRDGDGISVSTLLSQAQAADRDAAEEMLRSDYAQEQATTIDQRPAVSEASRAELVVAADSAGTPAGRAAAIAAQSHPTNPRDAASGPSKKSAGRARGAAGRARGTGADPQRTHRGR